MAAILRTSSRRISGPNWDNLIGCYQNEDFLEKDSFTLSAFAINRCISWLSTPIMNGKLTMFLKYTVMIQLVSDDTTQLFILIKESF